MIQLTTADKIRNNVRPVSAHLEESRINIYIEEAQQLNIKPRIGDALFANLLEWTNADNKTPYPAQYQTLVNGGQYQAQACGESETHLFKGLEAALNYYVYAKIVKNNNYTTTRFGFVEKTDEHSKNTELKERLIAEKDALTIADNYMADCIHYLKANTQNIPLFKKAGKATNKLRIKTIGD